MKTLIASLALALSIGTASAAEVAVGPWVTVTPLANGQIHVTILAGQGLTADSVCADHDNVRAVSTYDMATHKVVAQLCAR